MEDQTVDNENTIADLSQESSSIVKSVIPNSETLETSTETPYIINSVNITTVSDNYNSEDAKALLKSLNGCIDYIKGDVSNTINEASRSFHNFNTKTIQKMQSNGISYDMLFSLRNGGFYQEYYERLIENFEKVKERLLTTINSIAAIDEDSNTIIPQTITTINKGSSGSSHGSSSSVNNPPVSDIITTPSEDDTILSEDDTTLTSSITFGTIVLTEVVTLYETIGGVGVPSTLNGNYLVVGIVIENDKYYYKILDNDTKKTYFLEVTSEVNLQTEYKNLLHIKENAMMLNSMEIGSDNFVKLADPNTLYFVSNEAENNNITFYNVVDSSDGQSYYIPASNSVENIPLDSITTLTNIETGEVS